MLVVAEQHGIDRADVASAFSAGPISLLQLHMRQLIGAGRIEGRIGEQAKAIDLDQRGRAADQRDGNGHDGLLSTTTGFAGRVTR